MTYYGPKELGAAFRTVRKNTIQIAEEIPESRYDFRASPELRTVGGLLTHVALAPGFQYHIHSNNISDLKYVNFYELIQRAMAEEAKPRTKAEIVALLKTEGEKFASYLEGLNESTLAERVQMPPGADPATKS